MTSPQVRRKSGKCRTKATSDKRIDYCFVSAGLADRVVSSRIDSKCAASDHQPLWVELDI